MRRLLAWLAGVSLAAAPLSVIAGPDRTPAPAPDRAEAQQQDEDLAMPRARLGVALMEIGPELRRYFGAPADHGALVARVLDGSPAAAAGLAVGDVVTEVAAQKVSDAGDVLAALQPRHKGDKIDVRVVRRGAAQTLTVTLREDASAGAGWFFHSRWFPHWMEEPWRSLAPPDASARHSGNCDT